METPPTVWLPDSKWTRVNDPVVLDWERVRSQIQHEDMLINHRITWAVQINTMLLAAFAAGVYFISDPEKAAGLATLDLTLPLRLLLIVFVLFGALVSLITFRSVKMANVQISELVDWWKARISSEMDRHPPLVGESHARSDKWLRYGYIVPIAFIGLWLALAAFVIITFM
jgi:hypothetical protein